MAGKNSDRNLSRGAMKGIAQSQIINKIERLQKNKAILPKSSRA
jgi:hypothetical protein